MRYHRISLASLMLIVCVGVAAGTTVWASQPIRRTFQFTLDDEVLVNCGSFDVLEDSVTTIQQTIFFDQDGRAVRVQLHSIFSGTFSNSVTGASVADFPDSQTVVIDLVDGGFANHGLVFRITVPGEGNVLVNAGTVVFDAEGNITIHGPHTALEEGFGILCEVVE